MSRTVIVAWLRVVLPLAALALLSVLFLFGRTPTPDASIPYADVDPVDLAERQAMRDLDYAGVTSDGAQLSVTAAEGEPFADTATFRRVGASLRAPDGRVAELTAGIAQMQGDDISLSDQVWISTADGWLLEGATFTANRVDGTLRSDSPIDVQAPFGTLTAGSMLLRPKGDGTHVLDLNGGVRLLYRP